MALVGGLLGNQAPVWVFEESMRRCIRGKTWTGGKLTARAALDQREGSKQLCLCLIWPAGFLKLAMLRQIHVNTPFDCFLPVFIWKREKLKYTDCTVGFGLWFEKKKKLQEFPQKFRILSAKIADMRIKMWEAVNPLKPWWTLSLLQPTVFIDYFQKHLILSWLLK